MGNDKEKRRAKRAEKKSETMTTSEAKISGFHHPERGPYKKISGSADLAGPYNKVSWARGAKIPFLFETCCCTPQFVVNTPPFRGANRLI